MPTGICFFVYRLKEISRFYLTVIRHRGKVICKRKKGEVTMGLKNKIAQYRVYKSGVQHCTFNPEGPGVVRIHLIPPKFRLFTFYKTENI